MDSPTTPKQRLLAAIAAAYAPFGGHLVGDTLVLPKEEQPLGGLLHYLELIAHAHEFTHLPPLFGTGLGLPMASMFVELAVSRSPAAPTPALLGATPSLAAAQEDRRRRLQSQRLSVDDALGSGQQHNIVILGDPGGGKTSLLKRATALIASGAWPGWIVPLYIPLRRYWDNRRRYPDAGLSLLRYAAHRIVESGGQTLVTDYKSTVSVFPHLLAPDTKAAVDAMETLLGYISGPRREHVIFLLDGLDEVASDPDAVTVLGDEILRLASGFAWVVTSRRAGFFGGLEEDVRYEVVSLDNDGIEQLARNWFRHQEDLAVRETGADRVLSQIVANPRLLAMASNPFLLTLLCHLRAADAADLPLYRSEIYERIFKLAREQLRHREKDPARFGHGEMKYLAAFCRHLYTSAPRAPRQLFDRDDWAAFADPDAAPDLDRHFLESRLLDRWGEGDDYHLVHLTLHEFLIARDLADAPVEEALARIYHPHWRMVLRFLASLCREQELSRLIKAMVTPVDLNGLMYIEAAQLLIEAGVEDSSALLGYDLRDTLWGLWRENTPFVAEAAGQALAMLAPTLALERIRTVLDDVTGRIRFDTAPSGDPRGIDADRLALSAVRLLADVRKDEAVALLLTLLQDDNRPELADTAVHALAQRNWHAVRRAVLAVAASVETQSACFIRLCHIASFTRHRDFAPWLLDRLESATALPYELLEACALVGGERLETALLACVKTQPGLIASLSDGALDALAANAAPWRDWLRETLDRHQALATAAIRHRLLDEAATIALLSARNGDERAGLIEAIGDGAAANRPTPRAVEHAVASFLSGPSAVRTAAAYTLFRLDELRHARGLARGHDRLFARLLDDPDESTREIAVAAVAAAGAPAMAQRIMVLAGDRDQALRVRCAAIEALGRLPADSWGLAADRLEDWLDDPSPEVGAEGALALARTRPACLARHLKSERVRTALAQVGAEQGMLFFDAFYVDASGERHPWDGDTKAATQPTTERTRSVFVSYNSRDLAVVRDLVRELEAAGVDVLWDQDDLERKGRWQKELYELIQRAGGALIICGPHGPGDWQQEEIDACIQRSKKKGTEFDLRAVWLPGIEPEKFAGFLDNYDRVDLREGVRLDLLLARLNGPRRKTSPNPLPEIGATDQRYSPWPETNEHAETGKSFGTPYQPPKDWLQLDTHTRQRAHLNRHLNDPEVCARWSLEALGAEAREALELIHTGGLCAQPDYLAALWPRPWSRLVEDLDRGGLIVTKEHFLTVEVHVAACLNLDEAAIRARHEQWIERLLPLADHWDVGLELCLHLFSTKRYPEVVSLVHGHMLSVEEGWLRDAFGTVVDALANSPKIWRQLTPDERVLLLDTQGLHRLHKGDTDAALETFRRMGRIAARASDQWGMAQSWLHQGLTWFGRGDIDQAARCYRRSAECARNGEDDMLRGRALHNLAQCLMDNDPAQAAKVLDESAECKHRAGDTAGLFATYDARGLLAVHRDNLAEALRWFRRAERVARKSGGRRNLAHGLNNLASTLGDLGRHEDARPLGEEAYALAHELQDPELLVLATQGLAVRCHRAGDEQRALPLFLELSELKLARRDFAGAVVALSDAGAVCVQLNDYPGARIHLDQAIRLAREHGALDALLQAFGNYAASYRSIARIDEGLTWLEQAGTEAARRGEWCVLAKLAAIEAGWRDERNEDTADVRACWDRAITAAEHCRQWPYRLDLLQDRYAWLRDRLGYAAALPAAEELVALLARRRQHAEAYASALNELGNALQEQTRFDAARRRYLQALRALTRVDNPALQATVLNNLGELSRKTGRVEEAMTLYHQSLAKLPDDALEERFATEINLALAEAEAGDTKSAEKLLERVRDSASRLQLWPSNVTACLLLADIAWDTHRHGLALRRYDKVIQSAARHDLVELRFQAELNRAHLLLERERPAEVVSALGPLEIAFEQSPYRAELHLALADGHSLCGQTAEALATLRKALAPSGEAYAPIPWLDLHTALARALFDSSDPEGAWEAMARALTLPCPTDHRASLLIEAAELAVAIDRGRDGISPHVQAVVDAAQAETAWEPSQCRHFWRALGDTLWQADEWSGAAMCFINGMIEGAEDGNGHVEDGIYLFQRLNQLGAARARVMDEVRSGLGKQEQVDPATLQRLLWPLAMAERAGDKALSQGEVVQLFNEVWKHSLGASEQ